MLKTTEQFIEDARKVHGDRYDYSKAEYKGRDEKVCIICKEHGEFWMTPHNHVSNKQNCPNCRKITTESYIVRAKKKHNNYYSYEKTAYKEMRKSIIVTCPKHGDFEINAQEHLRGHGCKLCAKEKATMGLESFIERARQVHGDKYNYSKVQYKNAHTKVCIICPIHGEFYQQPCDHLSNHGCYECGRNSTNNSLNLRKLTTEEFISKAHTIHNFAYDYSKTHYSNTRTKLTIVCPKHGEFHQLPFTHLCGKGCPHCNESQLEKKISLFLSDNSIIFERQKSFEWLKNKFSLRLDFYLPEYNIAIECQGRQHFEEVEYFGGKATLLEIQQRDKTKHKLCEEQGIRILYFSDIIEYDNFLNEKLYHSTDELIGEIKNNQPLLASSNASNTIANLEVG